LKIVRSLNSSTPAMPSKAIPSLPDRPKTLSGWVLPIGVSLSASPIRRARHGASMSDA